MTSLHELLQKALGSPPDYSGRFSAKVADIVVNISRHCGLSTEHDTSMDYSSAQKISWERTESHPRIQYRLFVSSRGPLYTILPYLADEHGDWRRSADDSVFQEDSAVACVQSVLESHGYEFVATDLLERPAPGHVTDMDGAPASLRDVIFTELA